jgi:beta-N-acetylhexosaminidase
MILRRFLSILLMVSLVLSGSPTTIGRASGPFQGTDPDVNARQMLAKMTPEERVGQLFLVTFTGSTAEQASQIYDLIASYHVGGVVWLPPIPFQEPTS